MATEEYGRRPDLLASLSASNPATTPGRFSGTVTLSVPTPGPAPSEGHRGSGYTTLERSTPPRALDARTAEIELGKHKWVPSTKAAQSTTAFRTHIERLMKRARKPDAFTRMRIIRNALPNAIKEKTDIGDNEEEL